MLFAFRAPMAKSTWQRRQSNYCFSKQIGTSYIRTANSCENDNLQSPMCTFFCCTISSYSSDGSLSSQDKRSGRVSAVKVQAAQFGREQAWHCFWLAQIPDRGGGSEPAQLNLNCQYWRYYIILYNFYGIRHFVRQVGNPGWGHCLEGTRQCCEPYHQHSSFMMIMTIKSTCNSCVSPSLHLIPPISLGGRHPNIVCFYDLPVA